jgi:hypothetical protein
MLRRSSKRQRANTPHWLPWGLGSRSALAAPLDCDGENTLGEGSASAAKVKPDAEGTFDLVMTPDIHEVLTRFLSQEVQSTLASINVAFLDLGGGLTELREARADWHRLMEWQMDCRVAEAADLASEDSDEGWHDGFDIDSDGHWIPRDSPFGRSPSSDWSELQEPW